MILRRLLKGGIRSKMPMYSLAASRQGFTSRGHSSSYGPGFGCRAFSELNTALEDDDALCSDVLPDLKLVQKERPVLLALDTEFSAFMPKDKPATQVTCRDYGVHPVTIGWALFDKNGNLVDNYPVHKILKPDSNFTVTVEAFNFHRISTDYAQEYGESASKVFADFARDALLVAGQNGSAVGHNVQGDISLLLNEMQALMASGRLTSAQAENLNACCKFLYNNTFCTLDFSKTVNPTSNKWMKLTNLFERMVEKAKDDNSALPIDEDNVRDLVENAHLADMDATMAGFAFLGLKREKEGMAAMKLRMPSIGEEGGLFSPNGVSLWTQTQEANGLHGEDNPANCVNDVELDQVLPKHSGETDSVLEEDDDFGDEDVEPEHDVLEGNDSHSFASYAAKMLPVRSRDDVKADRPCLISIDIVPNAYVKDPDHFEKNGIRPACVAWSLFDDQGRLLEGYPVWRLVEPTGWEISSSPFSEFSADHCSMLGRPVGEVMNMLIRDVSIVAESKRGCATAAYPKRPITLFMNEAVHMLKDAPEEHADAIRDAARFLATRTSSPQLGALKCVEMETKRFLTRDVMIKRLSALPQARLAMESAGFTNEIKRPEDGDQAIAQGAIHLGIQALLDKNGDDMPFDSSIFVPPVIFAPPVGSAAAAVEPSMIGIQVLFSGAIERLDSMFRFEFDQKKLALNGIRLSQLNWVMLGADGSLVGDGQRQFDMESEDPDSDLKRKNAFTSLLVDLRRLKANDGLASVYFADFCLALIYNELELMRAAGTFLKADEIVELAELLDQLVVDSYLSGQKAVKDGVKTLPGILGFLTKEAAPIMEKQVQVGNNRASQSALTGLAVLSLGHILSRPDKARLPLSLQNVSERVERDDSLNRLSNVLAMDEEPLRFENVPIGVAKIQDGEMGRFPIALPTVSFSPTGRFTGPHANITERASVRVTMESAKSVQQNEGIIGIYGQHFLPCGKIDGEWFILPGTNTKLDSLSSSIFPITRTLFVQSSANDFQAKCNRMGGSWDATTESYCFQLIFDQKAYDQNLKVTECWYTTITKSGERLSLRHVCEELQENNAENNAENPLHMYLEDPIDLDAIRSTLVNTK